MGWMCWDPGEMDEFANLQDTAELPPFFMHSRHYHLTWSPACVSHEGQSCSILFTVNGFSSLLGGLNLVHCQLVQ